jgi:cysteine desulfurase/selenocysteine lyase
MGVVKLNRRQAIMANQTEVILRYSDGGPDVQDFRVGKSDILIGRASECDIHLDDKQVSRFHASLRVSADGIWLLDMDSMNGTLIDGQPIPPNQRISLHPEQQFSVGTYKFELVVPRPPSPDATIMQPDAPRGHMYDLQALRAAEFPQMLDWTNLDNAASAPAPQRTVNRMKQVLDEKIGTSQWHIGKYPLDLIGTFMASAANFVNAEFAQEIVYVEGCSVGLNLIAQSLDLKRGDNIVLCDLEYPANVYPWMSLQRDGAVVKQIPSENGGLTIGRLQPAVDKRTRVVAASAIQFFSGHRTDLAAIGKFCRERDILFVVDAIQAVGHIPIDVRRMNIDVLVTGGHKSLMTAPSVGFMYVREAVCAALQPRIVGALSTKDWFYFLNYDMSPHPGAWRFLIGTPNFVGMAGMIESMALLTELRREAIDRHTTRLAAHALQMAEQRGYALTTTPGEHGSIATIQSKLGRDETQAYLQGIEKEEKIAIARQVDRQGTAHLRMSFHCYNTEEEITHAFEVLDRPN